MIKNCGLGVCGNPEYGMNVGCEGCPLEIKETVVVNLRTDSYTKYIGRTWNQCGRNKFANPYRVGYDGSREMCIEKHKKDFDNNPELREAVWNELKGETLGCFCKPLACHGDTYVEYIRNRMRKNNETS